MANQARLNQIADLVNQWQQLVGYAVEVPQWMVSEMADALNYGGISKVSTVYDVGQYMTHHIGDPKTGSLLWATDQANAMPWAKYGMSASQYEMSKQAFDATWQTLTGQMSTPTDVLNQALAQHQGQMSGSQFETWLLAQDSIKSTYGWLKYGLNFNQFQQQKLSMRTQFGRDLTDQEAAQQLQYFHAAQGPNVGVAAQPTLTQIEKKAAQQGVSGNVVR